MVIILDTPYSLGDLSTETYPHVYITRTIIDGPANTVVVQWEVGTVLPSGMWQPTPVPTSAQLILSGADLSPFVQTMPNNLTDSLWQQVEVLIYQTIQGKNPRIAGSLGTGLPEAAPSVPSTTNAGT